MDNFMNLAKQGYSAYQKSSDDVSKTGGTEYNSPHHSDQDGSKKGSSPEHEIDHNTAIHNAKEHHDGSGDSDLFSSALNFLKDNKGGHSDHLDDKEVLDAHAKVYDKKDASGLSAQAIGSAAALQAFKQFTGSSSKPKKESGNLQSQLVGMAMAEATKMFDKSGGKGDKQDAVNGAAMTAMKLLVKSKLGGSPAIGGSNSGGLGSLLSLLK